MESHEHVKIMDLAWSGEVIGDKNSLFEAPPISTSRNMFHQLLSQHVVPAGIGQGDNKTITAGRARCQAETPGQRGETGIFRRASSRARKTRIKIGIHRVDRIDHFVVRGRKIVVNVFGAIADFDDNILIADQFL